MFYTLFFHFCFVLFCFVFYYYYYYFLNDHNSFYLCLFTWLISFKTNKSRYISLHFSYNFSSISYISQEQKISLFKSQLFFSSSWQRRQDTCGMDSCAWVPTYLFEASFHTMSRKIRLDATVNLRSYALILCFLSSSQLQ